MIDGLHHFHKSKITHSRAGGLKKVANSFVYVGGIFGPLLTIPQLTEIWLNKSAVGVSLISWTAYFIGALFWLFYGFVHKEKPIVFIYGFWAIVDLLIVVGIFLYG